MKLWYTLTLSILHVSYAMSLPMDSAKYQLSQQMDQRVATTLSKTYQLGISGTGGGRDPDNPGKVRGLNYCFRIYQVLSLDDARTLIVNAMEEVVRVVNQTTYAQQYVSNFPCSPENIWICISSFTPEGDNPTDPYIFSMQASANGILYHTKAAGQRYGYHRAIEESWDEAVRIVSEQG